MNHNNRRDDFDNRKNNFANRNEIDYKKNEDSAEKIARDRYAKGEISKDELKEILDNLNY
jgi:putative membrane protein